MSPRGADGDRRGHDHDDRDPGAHAEGDGHGDSSDRSVAELVDRGDLDELIRHLDRLSAARDWDAVDDLRRRARRAFERGRQLWPAATRAEYLLALLAPGRLAASVVEDGAGHLGPGPLAEVAASTHTWEELADHLPHGPAAGWCAHERVVRGDDLTGDPRVDPTGPELPLSLAPWEPAYPVATYRADEVGAPMPAMPALVAVELGPAGRRVDDPGTSALRELVRTWTVSSNGTSEAVAVEGDAAAAVAALGVDAARMARVPLAEAMALMAWAAASGGAHGRRAGAARGRFDVWWTLAVLTGLDDDWPPDPDELGAAAGELEWWVWDEGSPTTGWALRVAVADPLDGLAWALRADDHA